MQAVPDSLAKDILTSDQLPSANHGDKVKVAGMVIRVQRPLSKAVFVTLQDEFSHIPLMVFPKTYTKLRQTFKAPFLEVWGTVSRREGTLNIVIDDGRALNLIEYAPKVKYFR